MADRIKDPKRHKDFCEKLESFENAEFALVGLSNSARQSAFAAQLTDSVRRIEYLNLVAARSSSPDLHTPYSGGFQPFGGAVALYKAGRLDDAFWLLYLATHFGKHKNDGWNLAEDIYGKFAQGGIWDWESASADPLAVGNWLEEVHPHITRAGRSRRFGNHRKFETLKPGPKGTGHAVATYINWVGNYGSHGELLGSAQEAVGQNPQELFAYLYKELNCVAKLGRLGKFDFLCNISNLLIAPIFPDKAYISGSTGPRAGASVLFGNNHSVAKLDAAASALGDHLEVSPQAIEDALCNWQKSPSVYRFFRG